MISRRLPLGFVFFVLVAVSAHADDWALTTSDFQTQPAQLKGLSPQGVEITSPDTKSDRTIPLDQFVSIQRWAKIDAPAPKFTLILSNGDRLVGQPGPVAGEKLTWISPSLGKVPVPFSRLVAIGKGRWECDPADRGGTDDNPAGQHHPHRVRVDRAGGRGFGSRVPHPSGRWFDFERA
jgi:hypothetical protein